ncbi:MAG: hypothetical protein K2X93_00845 [Candidatus Obscuribacterales bacterium]|nr:hypothetical protein [Candidatus Obscuribacterales bacterium]
MGVNMSHVITVRFKSWISGCARLHEWILFLLLLGVFVGVTKGPLETTEDVESVIVFGTVGALSGLLLYWIVLFPGELQTEMAMYSFANRLKTALKLTRALDRSVDGRWGQTIRKTKDEVKSLSQFTQSERDTWRKNGPSNRYGFDGLACIVRELKRELDPTWVPSMAYWAMDEESKFSAIYWTLVIDSKSEVDR